MGHVWQAIRHQEGCRIKCQGMGGYSFHEGEWDSFSISFFRFSFFSGDGIWIFFSPFSLISLTRSSNHSMVRFNESVGGYFSISSCTCSLLCLISKWRALMPIRRSRYLCNEGRRGFLFKVRGSRRKKRG